MTFVYIHIVWFGCWIGFGVEDYPYGLLTHRANRLRPAATGYRPAEPV